MIARIKKAPKISLAMLAAAPAMPPNPRKAATMARTNKMRLARSMPGDNAKPVPTSKSARVRGLSPCRAPGLSQLGTSRPQRISLRLDPRQPAIASRVAGLRIAHIRFKASAPKYRLSHRSADPAQTRPKDHASAALARPLLFSSVRFSTAPGARLFRMPTRDRSCVNHLNHLTEIHLTPRPPGDRP